nr:bifunctional GNAT family N-acetyltransferase/carbon-nitrogen hydrolase family protein [Flocculibacter collagenilyticus]
MNDLKINVVTLEQEHYPQLKALMDRVYPDLGGAWDQSTIEKLVADFPQGQLAITDGDDLVGAALTVRVSYDKFSMPHSYDDLISTRNTIRNNQNGDALYGLDVFIHPDYRGYRLGRRLYDARKDVCKELNLKGILAGGRIVNYHKYSDELTPQEYIERVRRKEVYDPILSFQLSNDFVVKRLLTKYLPEDEKSEGYATLLAWHNILYTPEEEGYNATKTQIRIGAVQWQMRRVESVEDMLKQVEYFVDAISGYQSDFAVFPEFFNAPLMGLIDTVQATEAIRYLASFTQLFKDEMSRMAVSYNVNIITGSMPLLEEDHLYNVSYMCHRSGEIEEQRKIHITPHERNDWVLEGGNELRLFDTDAGKVGILICYDSEFPELGRLLSYEDVDVIFVPFWTDTKNGYLRVRHCSHARAIENECYVVICGSVGNLPSVDNLDVQYAQSAVFSPSDFAFSHDAVMAETTPNTEMLMFCDLDLEKLKLLRNEGSVTNRKDQRPDLYSLKWKGKLTKAD